MIHKWTKVPYCAIIFYFSIFGTSLSQKFDCENDYISGILSLELLCDHSIILWQCKLRFYDVKHHLHTN